MCRAGAGGEFRAESQVPGVCFRPCSSVLEDFGLTSWGLSFLICDKHGGVTRACVLVLRSLGSPFLSLTARGWRGISPCRLCIVAAWAAGSAPLGMLLRRPPHPTPPHNWGADAAWEAFVQTQVVPPATSSLILDHPTITFGPETICWVKGEEGLEGKEEEREGGGGFRG